MDEDYVYDPMYERLLHIYFIQCRATQLIKIGRCEGCLEGRVRAIQSMSPMPLEIDRLGVIMGWRDTEKKLHGRFRGLRHHGEWFEPGPELLEFIKRHAEPWPEEPQSWRILVEAKHIVAAHDRMLDELMLWAYDSIVFEGRPRPESVSEADYGRMVEKLRRIIAECVDPRTLA